MGVLYTFIMVYYFIKGSSESDSPSCSSQIFCQGELLHVVQTSKLYDDSKYFVDMMMKFDEKVILENFNAFMNDKLYNPTSKDVENFVKQHFETENELELWDPDDYSSDPVFLRRILNPKYQVFTRNLLPIWKSLGRKIKTFVENEKNASRSSIIPVPNGFIVPGGRFREFYYWDSYWIVVGLLHSDMRKTVKGILDNFIWTIKTYGFIPNGGRIYYLNRSQPPLFLMMVDKYLKYYGDEEKVWLKENILFIEMELIYWLKQKTVTFKLNNTKYTLARYIVNSSSPRPESYSEDLITCSIHHSEYAMKKCYRELKTGAESGWDFSSRWMTEKLKLYDMIVSEIAPVDLNAFLIRSFYIMAKLFLKVGRPDKHDYWLKNFKKWVSTLHKILYNEEDGIWYDFDFVRLKQNRHFFCSNFAPLWAELYMKPEVARKFGEKAVYYLIIKNVLIYNGGIPSSLYDSGEQWDLPNAWPNMQSIVILGLYRSGDEKARQVAKVLAEGWIEANLKSFKESKLMYEKYNAQSVGEPGSGGEYGVQAGFGLTNGVIFEIIEEMFSSSRSARGAKCENVMIGSFIIFYLLPIENLKL